MDCIEIMKTIPWKCAIRCVHKHNNTSQKSLCIYIYIIAVIIHSNNGIMLLCCNKLMHGVCTNTELYYEPTTCIWRMVVCDGIVSVVSYASG